MRAFYVCSKSENLLEDEPWTSKFFDIRIWLAFVRIVARFYNLLPCVLKSSYLFELYYIYVIKTYWQFLIPPHQDTLGIEVEDVCCHCMYPWKIPGICTTNLHNLFLLGILFGIFRNIVKTYWQFLILLHQDTLGIELEDICCHCMYPWKMPCICTTNLI